jgi:hypothetical protein
MACGEFNLSLKPVQAAALSIESPLATLKLRWPMGSAERVSTNGSDKEALVLAIRRFGWMSFVLYAIMSVGLWLAWVLFPRVIGTVTDYTISISLLAAVTFGGLYAAAMALRPVPPKESTPSGAR